MEVTTQRIILFPISYWHGRVLHFVKVVAWVDSGQGDMHYLLEEISMKYALRLSGWLFDPLRRGNTYF